jgi:predicted TIM-barrel fold metal-dependent hydrolase
MADFKLISGDSHINEPPAAWERVQKQYGDRAPKVVRDPQGMTKGTWLITEGMPPVGCSHYHIGRALTKEKGISKIKDENFGATVKFNETFLYEDFPGGWDPATRIKEQDMDGVGAEILFASPCRFFYALTDEPLQRAILKSYAGWLNDFCNYDRKRLIGLPLLSILNIENTVADMKEYAKQGFRGVQIPTRIADSGYYEKKYEPLWAAAVDLGLVINVHTSTTQGRARTHFEGPRDHEPWKAHFGFHKTQAPAQEFLGNLIFSGVFDRHPKLKVSCAEFDVGWLAHLYERIDYFHKRSSAYDAERNVNKRPPSEYMKENVYFTFQDDRAGMLTTPVFGEDNFLWASDYPHGVTTWPYSQETLESNCQGLKPELRHKVGRQNAAKLYGLEM